MKRILTNGKMARELGIDPKTLRKWARRGVVPSYIHPANGYRYFFVNEVIQALRSKSGVSSRWIDRRPKKQ